LQPYAFCTGFRTVACRVVAWRVVAWRVVACFTIGCLTLGLTVAGLALKSSLAILAFLAVFKVLIKLFFSMLIDGFSSKFCRIIFCHYRPICVKHGKGQTAGAFAFRAIVENKTFSMDRACDTKPRRREISPAVKN
jgi:hypothetical protein